MDIIQIIEAVVCLHTGILCIIGEQIAIAERIHHSAYY